MDRFYFVWNAATSYVKLALSFMKEEDALYHINMNSTPKNEIIEWIRVVGWKAVSCMDESVLMSESARHQWIETRKTSPNPWMDFISAASFLYETQVDKGEPTNLIWDHILSVCLITWDGLEGTVGIKEMAAKPDDVLQGDELHIKEVIRSLKRIRQAEQDPEADNTIGQDEEGPESTDAGLDDDMLIGLQSKMKEMLSKIQDPNSGLGQLMKEIMDVLKDEKIDLDPKTLMEMAMKSMMGGGGVDTLDQFKDGPLGKIMSIVENKVKERMANGGVDELKNILESTKEIFGSNPDEMKDTLMKLLQNMVGKMGLPKSAKDMLFSKMNTIIESMASTFMKTGQASAPPSQEDMQNMLAKNMQDVMHQMAQQQAGRGGMSKRKAERMASRRGNRTTPMGDPRLERLQKLKEKLRKKHEEKQRKKKD